MQTTKITVKGNEYAIYDASEDCGNGSTGYVHSATKTVFIGGVSATRHVFGECPESLPDILHDKRGYRQLGPSWEPLSVFIWLPDREGDGGYWREWNDHMRGSVWNSGGYRPSLGYSPMFATAEHPAFWEMGLENALKAWIAAKNLGERSVTVFRDNQGEYIEISGQIQYL